MFRYCPLGRSNIVRLDALYGGIKSTTYVVRELLECVLEAAEARLGAEAVHVQSRKKKPVGLGTEWISM